MTRSIRRMPRIMSEEELGKVIKTIKESPRYQKNFSGEFNKMKDITIILMCYYVGLRPAECLKLEWADVDWEKKLLYVHPYYNKERNDTPAVITEPGYNVLKRYKTFIEEADVRIDSKYLFPSLMHGFPLTTDAFAKRFQRIVREAGLLKLDFYTPYGRPVYNFSPYSLRHSFCTKVYKVTGSEIAVTRLARHKRPESAHAYIHLDFDGKKQIADKVFTEEI